MKDIGPLLDVIAGMLLVFVLIAAVGGAAPTADIPEPEGGSPDSVEEQILNLRLRRSKAGLLLEVQNPRSGGYEPVSTLEAMDLSKYERARVALLDQELGRHLQQIQERGLSIHLLVEAQAAR